MFLILIPSQFSAHYTAKAGFIRGAYHFARPVSVPVLYKPGSSQHMLTGGPLMVSPCQECWISSLVAPDYQGQQW